MSKRDGERATVRPPAVRLPAAAARPRERAAGEPPAVVAIDPETPGRQLLRGNR